MPGEASGWLWLLINVGFVLALGLALIYGTRQWARRSRASKAAGEQATKEMYRSEDRAEKEIERSSK